MNMFPVKQNIMMKQNLLHKDTPNKFRFSPENLKKIETILKKYPENKKASGVIPLLDITQRQNGNWLSVDAMNAVAEILEMPYIRVYEVATFYSMFNLKPVGKHFIQLCRTTPCWLRKSDELRNLVKTKLGIGKGETTADGQFTYTEVECLGACVNAPVVQINDDYYEDVNPEILSGILDDLVLGKKPDIGTQVNRKNSAPRDNI